MAETITTLNPPKRKRQSRRVTLRLQTKQYISYLRSLPILHTTPTSRKIHYLHCAHTKISRQCNDQYGFTANPLLTHWTNIKLKLSNISITEYTNNINNLTYHNLCVHFSPPQGTKQLLGLGPKFIPQRAFPNPAITSSFNAFQHDARLKYTFAGAEPSDFTKNDRKIYVKSTWIPPPGNYELESRLNNFRDSLLSINNERIQNLTKPSYNLNRIQHNTLNSLKNNDDIIILLADKNLGPVTMDKHTYIKRILNDHLSDHNTYCQLSETTAERQLQDLREQLTHLFQNPSAAVQNALSEPERKYFNRSFRNTHRTPTFYGLVKIHKNPWTLRPVVSCCGSLLATVSTWIDFHLQKIRHNLPAFIKDSTEFQTHLKNIQIPKQTKILTCDAVSMYTNIEIDHSIAILHAWFEEFTHELPPNMPTNLIIAALDIVMKNNIFTFGDTTWLQLKGTAMGTPCACMIASIYFAYHERKNILRKYSPNILFYKRFIDDVFCLWIDEPSQNTTTNNNKLDAFKSEMNNFGSLRWEFEPLTTETNFLDLSIKLIPKPLTFQSPNDYYSVHFKTYQKPMNLYLYIPPNSAHPPGVIRSLIHSQIQKYWIQNTNPDDFKTIIHAFFTRLLDRGHNIDKLRQLFRASAIALDSKNLLPDSPDRLTQNNQLYLKWRYHPKDIPRKTLRHIYCQTCESPSEYSPKGFKELYTDKGPTMAVDKLTIAYTRDRNLRDILIPSRLRPSTKYKVSDFLSSKKGDNNRNNNE